MLLCSTNGMKRRQFLERQVSKLAVEKRQQALHATSNSCTSCSPATSPTTSCPIIVLCGESGSSQASLRLLPLKSLGGSYTRESLPAYSTLVPRNAAVIPFSDLCCTSAHSTAQRPNQRLEIQSDIPRPFHPRYQANSTTQLIPSMS
jgi:hypothetical protein